MTTAYNKYSIYQHDEPWPMFIVDDDDKDDTRSGTYIIRIGSLSRPLAILNFEDHKYTGSYYYDPNNTEYDDETDYSDSFQIAPHDQHEGERVRPALFYPYQVWIKWDPDTKTVQYQFADAESTLENELQLYMGHRTHPPEDMHIALWLWYVCPRRRQYLKNMGLSQFFFRPTVSVHPDKKPFPVDRVLKMNSLNRITMTKVPDKPNMYKYTFTLNTYQMLGLWIFYVDFRNNKIYIDKAWFSIYKWSPQYRIQLFQRLVQNWPSYNLLKIRRGDHLNYKTLIENYMDCWEFLKPDEIMDKLRVSFTVSHTQELNISLYSHGLSTPFADIIPFLRFLNIYSSWPIHNITINWKTLQIKTFISEYKIKLEKKKFQQSKNAVALLHPDMVPFYLVFISPSRRIVSRKTARRS